MKKLYLILLLLTLSVSALAQSGQQLYKKYSDLPGMEAVYISPAMFRIIGRLPDFEINDGDVDLSPIIKSLKGFYMLSTDNPKHVKDLYADIAQFIDGGNYELLLEAKEDGEVVRIYVDGDEKTVTSLVMIEQQRDEINFLSMDGNMDRDQLGDILARASN